MLFAPGSLPFRSLRDFYSKNLQTTPISWGRLISSSASWIFVRKLIFVKKYSNMSNSIRVELVDRISLNDLIENFEFKSTKRGKWAQIVI